jgi:hypothetical protein
MDPLEDFENVRQHKLERCGEETYFPKLGKVLCCWEKEYIPVGELIERDDIQLWVGQEGEWNYEIWEHTGTAQANEIAKHWDTIVNYLPDTEYMHEHIDRIGPELTNLVLYNTKEETGIEFPLFLVENSKMLPLNCGSLIDGSHRYPSIINSFVKGDIQESSPVPIWRTRIPDITMFGYNMLALFRLRMPLEKKIKLIEERILVGKKK